MPGAGPKVDGVSAPCVPMSVFMWVRRDVYLFYIDEQERKVARPHEHNLAADLDLQRKFHHSAVYV